MINIMYAVDPIKRIVKPMSGHAVTEQDHEASSLRFAFPDNIAGTGLDSTGTAVRVMYIRPDGGDPVAKTLTFYKHSGGYYLYDWTLQKSDLQECGCLVFSLCVLTVSEGVASEEWHTAPYSLDVLHSIHTDDSDEADETITPTVAERVAVLESMIQRIASGAPIVVSSVSAMTDTKRIYVLTTDGKWYYYDGSAWTAGGEYGAVATDTTLTQSGIPADAKAVGDAVGKCYEILVGNFETYANPHWEARYYSVFIPVKPGASLKITANSRHDALCACLKTTNLPPEVGDTANFSEASGWTTFKTVTQGNTYSGTIPSDAEYLYVYIGADETMLFKPTSVIVEGVDYFGSVSGNIIMLSQALTESNVGNTQKIDAAVSAVTNLYPFGIEPFQLSLFKRTQNLFSNFCYYRNKRYYRSRLSTSTVVEPRITETANYKGWLIRIKPNTTYTMGGLDFKLELLKLDFYLDKTISSVSSSEPNTITTGEHSYWMCLTQSVNRDMSAWMLVEGDTYPAEYVSGKPQWVESLDDDEDDHSGITIAFMGDSITAGVATTKCYHQYIHDKYGFTCLNYGFGGSGFYRNSTSQNSGRVGQGVPGIAPATTPQNFFTPNNIVARLSELDADVVNLIVIFAGTNDWGNGVTIENYITGIESAFDYCLNNFPTIPVMVMTPIHRRGDTVQNSQGKTLREYADILIEECKKYSIPYIDTMTDAGIYPDNDTNKEAYFVTDTSGLHPSASGHKRIANAVWERIAGKVL